MGAKLTPKQDQFARRYVELSNASQAYREVYDVKPGTKDETTWNNASRILANPKVLARVEELYEEAKERCIVTVESLTLEFDENREEARKLEQAAAMNTATTGKAKLHGLMSDKIDANLTGDITINFNFGYERTPSGKKRHEW